MIRAGLVVVDVEFDDGDRGPALGLGGGPGGVPGQDVPGGLLDDDGAVLAVRAE
jgi:hypothetical protein